MSGGILVGSTVFQGAYPGVGDRLANSQQFDIFALRTPFAMAKQKVFYTEGQWPASSNSPQPVGELFGAGIHLIISLKPGRDPTGNYSSSHQASMAPSGATLGQEKASLAAALSLFSGLPGASYEVVLWNEPNISSKGVFPFTTPTAYQAYVNYYGPTITAAGVPLDYIVGMSQPSMAISFFATGLGFVKILADYYANGYYGNQHITLDGIEALADQQGLPFGIGEFGRAAASTTPTVAQTVSWADSQIYARFTARLSAGKPTTDVLWWGANPAPNIINASTSPLLVAELDKIWDALTNPAPPPPPPPPPPGPPPAAGITSVTVGPLSGVDAVLAASSQAQGSVWPAPTARQLIALSPSATGSALMPNPEIIPATLQLQGSPPLVIPGGQAGQVLTSDNAGNITLQAGSTIDTVLTDIKSDGIQSAGSLNQSSAADHIHQYQSWLSMYQAASAPTAETIPRGTITSSAALSASGTLFVTAIGLPKGLALNGLGFYTGGTPLTGLSHGWYVLLDNNRVVRAATADQTSGSWLSVANTDYPLLISGSYTTSYSGQYYIGIMAVATGMPSIATGGGVNAGAAGKSLIFCGLSSTGQTTPPSNGSTLAAITVNGSYNFGAYTY